MLQRQELHIGNNVLSVTKIVQVTAMDLTDTILYTLEPIPLTPAMLYRLGFDEEKPGLWVESIEGFKLTTLYDGMYIQYIDFTENAIGIPFTSVHQLQNRYYSHTGKELELL